MGGMGGAQPLAIKMNEGVCLDVEVDEARIRRRVANGYCDRIVFELEEALEMAHDAKASGTPLSIGLVGNCAEIHPELVKRRIRPDVVTDQTSAHDPLGGYIPRGLSVQEADALRSKDPTEYVRRSRESIAIHVRAMLDFLRAGSVVFDYGNNIRGQAKEAGVDDAFAFQGFVPLFIRPLFAEGRGPFRWVAVTGNPDDIIKTDSVVLREFPNDETLARALLVCDGTEDAERRIVRVLTTDPGMGVVRHADAGYEDAIRFAAEHGIRMPSRE